MERLPAVLRTFIKDEAIGGKLILLGSIAALIAVNSPLRGGYESFWHQSLSIGFDDNAISLSLREWVSQGLMAVFFLVVGLEIKREFIRGELSRFRTAVLPIGAAAAGIIVPATIFLSINHGQTDTLRGWAIPTATDTAFAIGVLSLLGRRVTSSLKIFLLTLAIVDDIGSIIVITLFYGRAGHGPIARGPGDRGLHIAAPGPAPHIHGPVLPASPLFLGGHIPVRHPSRHIRRLHRLHGPA